MAAQKNKLVRTSVLLPEASYAQIQAMAAASDVSAAWIVRHALLKFLAEHQGQTELPLRLRKD